MELKVWVEGLQRVVCGVSESTTCQDVVIALAQATGKTGRFTLIEKWRNNERLLSPSDYPLLILRKWGEYASNVQLILKQSDKALKKSSQQHGEIMRQDFTPPISGSSANIKKALSFSGAHISYSKEVSKRRTYENPLGTLQEGEGTSDRRTDSQSQPSNYSADPRLQRHGHTYVNDKNSHSPTRQAHRPVGEMNYHSLERHGRMRTHNNLAKENTLYGSLERGRPRPAPRDNRSNMSFDGSNLTSSMTSESVVKKRPPAPPTYESLYGYHGDCAKGQGHMENVRNNGLGDHLGKDGRTCNNYSSGDNDANTSQPFTEMAIEEFDLDKSLSVEKHNDLDSGISADMNVQPGVNGDLDFIHDGKHGETYSDNEADERQFRKKEYEDLLKLLQLQQDKLKVQDAQMRKMESDIMFWESQENQYSQELSLLESQHHELEMTSQHYENEIGEMDTLSETLNKETQDQNTINSELTLMKSKLSHCENELMQSNNKLQAVLDELDEEEDKIKEKMKEESKMMEEEKQLADVYRERKNEGDGLDSRCDELESEMGSLEEEIGKRKQEVTNIETDLREINMLLFLKAPSSECLLTSVIDSSEGKTASQQNTRAITSRKMTASPQQLANIAPSAKHPHGLWV